MNMPHSLSLEIFFCKKSGSCDQQPEIGEELGIIVKIVGDEMAGHVKETLVNFDILLTTFRAKFLFDDGSAVKTRFICAIFFMTHGVDSTQKYSNGVIVKTEASCC